MTKHVMRTRCEDQVRADYEAIRGKVILVRDLTAYVGDTDNQQDFHFDPPIAVLVDNDIDEDSLLHDTGTHLDPYWDVTVVVTHPDLPPEGVRSPFVYGHSYDLKTGLRDGTTPYVMQPEPTQDQIERLKREWEADPCYDLWSAVGYEPVQEELRKHQATMEEFWANKARSELEEYARLLGCPDNLTLAARFRALERELENIKR